MASNLTCQFFLNPPYHYSKLVLALCILILNGFVVILFSCKRSLQKHPGNYILASLGVNDFLNGLILIFKLVPVFYLASSEDCVEEQRKIWILDIPSIFRAIYRVLMISSVLHLVCLSSDRIIHVMHGLKYKSLVRRHRVLLVIGLQWMISLLLGGIQLLWTLKDSPWKEDRDEFRIYHVSVLSVFVIVIPSIVLLIQSVTMVKIISRLDTAMHCKDRANQTARRKAFLLYALMYLLFVLFSYPYFITTFLYILKGHFAVPIQIIKAIVFARFLPCLVNPCFYALHNRDYKKALKHEVRKFKNKFFRNGWRSKAYTLRRSTMSMCSVTDVQTATNVIAFEKSPMNLNPVMTGFRRRAPTSRDDDGTENILMMSTHT